MADPTADIVAAIENGRLGDTLTQPLTKREVDALVECSVSDAGAPLEPDMLARLAITKSQSPAEFERIIARLKAETDVRIAPLEDLIRKQATAERQNSGQGQAVSFLEIGSWEEAVDAKSLLDQMVREIRRYVALSAASALSVALWIMHSYCYSIFEHTPRLAITSPEKRCGKTTLLSVISHLVPRALVASHITPAAMFRTVEKYHPTVLIDEADTFLKDNEEMRGLINSGHRRGGTIIRLVGDEHEPHSFSTHSPLAIAAIGALAGTIEDRSVIVSLRRRQSAEQVERFRSDRVDHLHDLARKVARWIDDNVKAIANSDPAMPDGLHDRACDNWTVLLAIADRVGGDWPVKARQAAVELAAQAEENADLSKGTALLQDVRAILAELPNKRPQDADRISSSDLAVELGLLPDRPWKTWNRGNLITPAAVAKFLKPYGIGPNTIKLASGSQPNGYKRSQFEDAFKRYLPDLPTAAAQASPTSPTQQNPPVSGQPHASPSDPSGEDGAEARSGGNAGIGEVGELNLAQTEDKHRVEPESDTLVSATLDDDGAITAGDLGPMPDYIFAIASQLPSQERPI